MLLAQITDTHLRADGAHPRHDPALALERAVRVLNAMRPRPDAVVLTGDVLDRTAADYSQALALLARLEPPLLPLPGNHDRAAPFRAAFAPVLARQGITLAEGHFSLAAPVAGHLVVGLDTTADDGGAALGSERLAWLAGVLDGARAPVVLALHHPPFALGIPRLDRDPFAGRDGLERVLRASGRLVRVIAGHSHRAVSRTWAGAPASTAPALGHALALSLVAGAPHAHTAEAPGLQLHLAQGGDWITHTLALPDDRPPQGFGTPLGPEAAALVGPAGG
jgi:3',5'-cyclic AMP phosphodiesterase CpdA